MKKGHIALIILGVVLTILFIGKLFFGTGNIIYDLTYGAREGDYCGDNSCNNEETCSNCPEDCGVCTSSGGSSGGGSNYPSTNTEKSFNENPLPSTTEPPSRISELENSPETQENEKTKQGIFRLAGGAVTDFFGERDKGEILWIRIFALIIIVFGLSWIGKKFLQKTLNNQNS